MAAASPPHAGVQRRREAAPRADAANDARREAPATAAAPRAADETRTLADAPASARDDAQAKDLDASRERRAETSAQAKAAAPALRSAPEPAATAGAMQAAPAAAPLRQARTAPLRALVEALAEESPRWRWQRDGTSERALTPELQAWLQRLDHALADRAARADTTGLAVAPEQASVQELRLLRDGGIQAIVRFEADGRIRIEIAGEAPLTAQLPAASTSALRRALGDATR